MTQFKPKEIEESYQQFKRGLLNEAAGIGVMLNPAELLLDASCISRFLRPSLRVEADDQPVASMFMEAGPGGKKIARIDIVGVMAKSSAPWATSTSTIGVRRELQKAVADPEVAGIMLAIDSPGGYVAGTHDLASDVKAAGRQKPVWAQVEDLGASAAYWVASQADRIVANSPTAMVGSIGTIQAITDLSAALEQHGIKVHVIKTGPLKGIGLPGAKVTDEQLAHLQGLANSVQESFDTAVQKGRRMTDRQLADVRHGGVLNASAALDAKLIDAVQPYGRTMAEFSAALKGSAQDYRRALDVMASGRPYTIDAAQGIMLIPEPVKALGAFPMRAKTTPAMLARS